MIALRLILPMAFALGMAGCDAPQGSSASASAVAGKVPVSRSAGPGAGDVSVAEGSALLQRVCVETLPDFRSAPARLAQLPFVQNAVTKTYFHRQLNLSFKISPGRCSMVMAGRDLGPQSAAQIVQSTAGKAVSSRPSQIGGQTFLRLLVE